MDNHCYLSIIIPVYNSENYIENTLNSIVNQSFKDYEILIINDGSKDNSLKVLENFKNKHNNVNITLINQENQGVGKARNVGISLSRGKYIHFIDADDELLPNALQTFYVISQANDYDIIMGGVEVKKVNDSDWLDVIDDISLDSKGSIRNWLNNMTTTQKDWMLNVLWNKWFKKSTIIENNLEFINICPGEDYEFISHYLCFAFEVFISKEHVYRYFIRELSEHRSLLNKKYSLQETIERREKCWSSSKRLMHAYNFYNVSFYIAEAYSIYASILLLSKANKKKTFYYLRTLKNIEQISFIPLYFYAKNTLLSRLIARVFKTKNIFLLRIFLLFKT